MDFASMKILASEMKASPQKKLCPFCGVLFPNSPLSGIYFQNVVAFMEAYSGKKRIVFDDYPF